MNEMSEAYKRICEMNKRIRKENPPLCIDCAHHRLGFFGRHRCYGYVDRDPVTGRETVLPDSCASARHTHYVEPAGFTLLPWLFPTMSAACGPEARLFKQRDALNPE